jgi:myosin heavy subunit
LDEFSEGAIIHQIRQRYKNDDIYTYIGNILIAVNPFKQLGIYGNTTLQKYFGKNTSALDPHVFAVANITYQSLLREKIDQSIIISGESGSGKTETTKLVLQFLSDVAGSKTGVEQQIMLSNPILEAFGNAKTSRNNNSSRFGKWMEILFNNTGHIVGCKIVNYLLEKSRVVQQAKGERNYHFFYQLCAGSSAADKVQFKIWNADRYSYLNKTGTFYIEGVNDSNDYAEVIDALQKLQFTSDDIENIVAVVASILHLGNIVLAPNSGDGDSSSISNPDQLKIVSNIIQVSPEALENAICFRTLMVRNETQIISLNPEQATDTRDSLSKAMYGNLFDWIIKRINQFLYSSADDSKFSIGVLDIFGFEVFEKNSFEQFCINFANEKLQALFNDYVFRMECAEYEQEGVTFPGTGFVDNTQTLLLISGIIDK